MRIAFITSDYSGLPKAGGTGTYYKHAAECLVDAGHEIEVFTAGVPNSLPPQKGIVFHQLGEGQPPFFALHAAEAFIARNQVMPFDVLESSDLRAEGLYAMWRVPGVAHVVRIHSPSVILNRYAEILPTARERMLGILQQMRISLGAWKRRLPIPPIHLEVRPPLWVPTQETDERAAAAAADLVVVMNEEMRNLVRDYWGMEDRLITEIPNPFRISSRANGTEKAASRQLLLTFSGRLEPRKGVLELVEALRRILPRHPDWKVAFAGHSTISAASGADIQTMMQERLKPVESQVQFLGLVPASSMGALLDETELYVFPSLWDNFPYAVVEAMAAGKAIVATRTGSIPKMLDDGRAGLLVEPGNVSQLTQALDTLMSDPERRKRLGKAARQRLQSEYSEEKVASAIIAAYQIALERRDQRLKSGR